MRYLLIVLCCMGMFSCQPGESGTQEERPKELDIISVAGDDKEMNAAIEKARQTLDEFFKVLKSKKYDSATFAVKMKFTEGEAIEHIWLSDIREKEGRYFGIISNEPEYITYVKMGDTAEIWKVRISDWMYADSGKLRGGYTIRVLNNRVKPEEKAELVKELGLKIED